MNVNRLSIHGLRDILSVVQISIALATVVLAGGGSRGAVAIATLVVLLAFIRPIPARPTTRGRAAWTAIVALALVATIFRAVLRAEVLDAGVDFLLLLIVQRLFHRQRPREHLQLLLLGAVLVVIGAVINTGLGFPILFAVFVPISTMAMLVNHLVAEAERLGARVRYDLDRDGPKQIRTLWRWAFQVAFFAASGGAVVFVVVPRFGVGAFLRGDMGTETISGFSEQVQLGGFGTIKTDATIVMHLDLRAKEEKEDDGNAEREPPEAPPLKHLPWHLRGIAFDHYESGQWGHSPHATTTPLLPDRGFWFFADTDGRRAEMHVRPREQWKTVHSSWRPVARPIPGYAGSTETLRVIATLEDIGTELLFAASAPLGVALEARGPIESRQRITADVDLQIRVFNRQPGPIQYEFLSRIGRPTRDELLHIGTPLASTELARAYLQRPQSLSPEFTNLAQSIVGDASTHLQKTEAILDFLLAFQYTTEQRTSQRVLDGADPVEGFVFDTRAGHCEYFATAMALLLREVGVPSRNVNGYYGAHHNPIGDFYTVRQADAHSWVEVYFGRLGWITFDPTPPSGRSAGRDAPWFPAVTQLLDAAHNTYLNYIIDYDLGKQIEVLGALGVRADRTSQRIEIDWERASGPIALPFGLALLLGTLIAVRRRRRRTQLPRHQKLYLALLDVFRIRGIQRQKHESPTHFFHRVSAIYPGLRPSLIPFATAYESLRFGQEPSNAADRELAVTHLCELASSAIALSKALPTSSEQTMDS